MGALQLGLAALGAENDLGEAAPVAQVDENEPAVARRNWAQPMRQTSLPTSEALSAPQSWLRRQSPMVSRAVVSLISCGPFLMWGKTF